MNMRFVIRGGTSLLCNEENATSWNDADILISGNRIAKINTSVRLQHDDRIFDAHGLLVLPGIVDLHGDAFERQIQPRPETVFSHAIALADTDRQLICNGITTACHGVTFSWEGGLRGREAAVALIDEVARQRKTAHVDHRIHLRFENHHLDGLQDALDWIAQGKIDFLAFNEHLPSIARKCKLPGKLAAYAERARCDGETFMKRLHVAEARSREVAGTIETLAVACREHGIPMASHDDETRFDRERYQNLRVEISEFPKTAEALEAAVAMDNLIVMGAPNILLGGSHCGGLSAADAVRDSKCDILTSDYFYPSMLHGAFKLVELGACSLTDAWALISENPAHALELADRGRITEGYRADMVLVDAADIENVRLIATIAGGKLAYCAEPDRLMISQPVSLVA